MFQCSFHLARQPIHGRQDHLENRVLPELGDIAVQTPRGCLIKGGFGPP